MSSGMREEARRRRPRTEGGGGPDPRRPYAPPRLEVLGDLRSLTLGPSPGLGDSGGVPFEVPVG